MWIATTDGFYSTVQKPGQKNDVTVRSRVKADLEKLMNRIGVDTKIVENAGTDYPFRIIVRKELWLKYLKEAGQSINYDNFKNTLNPKDDVRHAAYFKVWAALRMLED